MTYGTVEQANGRVKGYLHFDTGKVVRLNPREVIELENKIRYWQDTKNDLIRDK